MTDNSHVTSPSDTCEVYIFIFTNAWACLVGAVVECKTGMLVVLHSILGLRIKST